MEVSPDKSTISPDKILIMSKSKTNVAIIRYNQDKLGSQNKTKSLSIFPIEGFSIEKKMRELTDVKLRRDSDENLDVDFQILDKLGSWGNNSQPEILKGGMTPQTPNTEDKREAQNTLTQMLLDGNNQSSENIRVQQKMIVSKMNFLEFTNTNGEIMSKTESVSSSDSFKSDQDGASDKKISKLLNGFSSSDIQRSHAKIWTHQNKKQF